MSNPILRSRRLAENPPLAVTHSWVGACIHHVSSFKAAVTLAQFAPRALPTSEFMNVPVSLASGR
jgi:hypothetical protein